MSDKGSHVDKEQLNVYMLRPRQAENIIHNTILRFGLQSLDKHYLPNK